MHCQKHLFDLDPQITYLNCAYMSPLMHSVVEAGISGIKRKQHPWKVKGEDFFNESDELRNQFAKLINAPDPKRCVIIPSVSYGMANVANNLNLTASDEILVIGEQFPSNVYPWKKVAQQSGATIKTISAPDTNNNRATRWNEEILYAITPNTKLVACGHIHWADGTLFDLMSIRARTKDVGALLVIDGTQSIGAFPFDVQEIQPDALIVAGYKSMMGPYSIGMSYYGEAFDEGNPIEENWINRSESENFANLVNYNDNYQASALRYEVGEHSNFILVPMMLEALNVLNNWGANSIKNYCDDLVSHPVSVLREHGFVIEDQQFRASNLFGIRLGKQHSMVDIKRKLMDEQIIVSYRGDAIRISPNIYNNAQNLDKMVMCLTS